MKKIILTIFSFSLSNFVFADDIGPTKDHAGKIEIADNKPFRFEGNLSYLLNSSKSNGANRKKENLAASLLFQRQVGIWGQEIRAEAVNASDNSDSGSDVERYMLSGKVLHHSSDTIYQYVKLQGDKDLSSTLDYQVSLTGGLGYDLIKQEKQELTSEFGLGYRYSKERYEPHDAYNEIIGTLGLYYQYKFNDQVKFNQDASYDFGVKAQVLRSRTSLSAHLTRSLAGVASYQYKNTQADAGDSQDSLVMVGLNYSY